MACVLVVQALTRRFGAAVVLSGVAFTVEAGRAVAVVGPNGVGKTTLLRCVVGADRPDAGAVLLDGRPLREADPQCRRDVASVLDDVDFFPDLSVAEHLDLLARAHGVRPETGLVLAELGLVLDGLALRACLALGPLLAGPAVRHWVLASPLLAG